MLTNEGPIGFFGKERSIGGPDNHRITPLPTGTVFDATLEPAGNRQTLRELRVTGKATILETAVEFKVTGNPNSPYNKTYDGRDLWKKVRISYEGEPIEHTNGGKTYGILTEGVVVYIDGQDGSYIPTDEVSVYSETAVNRNETDASGLIRDINAWLIVSRTSTEESLVPARTTTHTDEV